MILHFQYLNLCCLLNTFTFSNNHFSEILEVSASFGNLLTTNIRLGGLWQLIGLNYVWNINVGECRIFTHVPENQTKIYIIII